MTAVIVTGAASGMGAATVERLAGRGVGVLAVDRDADKLEELAAATEGDVQTAVADVASEHDVRSFAEQAKETYGIVDGLFQAAGITGGRKNVVEMPVEEWNATMGVNLLAPFLGMKYVIPILRRPAGSVVTVSSVAAVKAEPTRSDYVVSKAGVIALTKTAASEFGEEGLRINCILPGPIDTPMMAEHEPFVDPDVASAKQRIADFTLLKRYGKPEEIAALVDFLLLGESEYITGAAIYIDGGYLAF